MNIHTLFLSALVLLPFALVAKPLDVQVGSEAAILINADSGAILYEKNARKTYYPASITKVITAWVALKSKGHQLDYDVIASQDAIGSISPAEKKKKNYTLPPHWIEVGSSHVGIKRGEKLTFRSLLYGMMLASGNDAANMIAEFSGGTIPKFIDEMNRAVKEVGAVNSHFLNPHGLHHPKHITTAYDMALITQEALKEPFFREVVSTVRYTRPKTNKQPATTWVQSNRLIKDSPQYYPSATGVKTGYHSNASHTLVASAEKNGRSVIAVLLKSKDRTGSFKDATALFEAAFNEEKTEKVLLSSGQQNFRMEVEELGRSIPCMIDQPVKLRYYPSEEPKMTAEVFWEPGVESPIIKGQRLGELRLYSEKGEKVATVPLKAVRDESPSLFYTWFGIHLPPIVSYGFLFFSLAGLGWFGFQRIRR